MNGFNADWKKIWRACFCFIRLTSPRSPFIRTPKLKKIRGIQQSTQTPPLRLLKQKFPSFFAHDFHPGLQPVRFESVCANNVLLEVTCLFSHGDNDLYVYHNDD